MSTVQSTLQGSVSSSFAMQIQGLKDKIQESVGPYSRFVRLEKQKNETFQASLLALRDEVRHIRNKVREQ